MADAAPGGSPPDGLPAASGGPSGHGGITLRELDSRPVTDLNGVGKARAKALTTVEVETVLDLLGFYPRRYLDRSREATVAQLEPGVEGMVLVRIDRVTSRRTRKGRSLVEVRASDSTGRLRLTFFNQPWRERQLVEGMQAVVFGKADDYQGTPVSYTHLTLPTICSV